jgi:hypothetical protein
MTKTYCTNGKPLDILKREAKALAKDDAIKLGKAQEKLAQDAGFSSWQELMEKRLEVGEPEMGVMPEMVRFSGSDMILFEVMTPEAFEVDTLDIDDDDVAPLYARVDIMVGEEDSVEWGVRLVTEPEATRNGIDGCVKLEIPEGQDREVFLEALYNAYDAEPGNLITFLSQDGFFDLDLRASLRGGEHDAVLMLEARKLGLTLGERIMFNTGIGSDEDGYEIADWNRRCFVNLLSDDSVMVSNGDIMDLRWHVLPKHEFEALKDIMESSMHKFTYTTQAGEIWMHDRVLAAEPDASPAP